MGYPDKESEIEMLETHQATSPLTKVTAVVTSADVAAMIATVQRVYVSQAIKEYTVSIGRATRESAMLRLGASPRSMLQLLRAAKATAALEGRDFVLPGRRRRRCRIRAGPPDHPGPQGRQHRGNPAQHHPQHPGQAAGAAGDVRAVAGRRPAQPGPAAHPLGEGATMALMDRLPGHLFTTRGWGLLAAGVVSLLAAQVMGRRDLLTLGILLILLPLVSLAGIRVLKPRFQVYREFNPASVETSSTTTVRLAVARTGIATGQVVMEEHLPPRFGDSPAFRFPARSAAGGTSRYEYHLRSGKRGQFVIGPVTAEFTDPFGLSLHRHAIDDGDILTVTPAAVELPPPGWQARAATTASQQPGSARIRATTTS